MNPGRWYAWVADRVDAIRGSFWFYPALMALGAGGAAMVLLALDRQISIAFVDSVPGLTRMSAGGARSILSTIAGSMMTVTSVVFSITIVALTLTSSQFGPRLLRTFLRDRASQIALGTFVATFFYSLLVLQAVEEPDQVPYVATAVGVALAAASLFVLIFFIHHATNSIQASSVIAAVVCEIDEQIDCLFPEQIGSESDEPAVDERLGQEFDESGEAIRADASGYVRLVDDEALIEQARARSAVVRLETRPGRFVTAGSTLARVVPAERVDEEFVCSVREGCLLGDHRTAVQDLGFLTDQLAEMAVRALSPGVNDPKTAVDCVHRMGSVLARLASRHMPSGVRLDADGAVRLVAPPTRFDEIAASCLDPVRRYGAEDAQVVCAVLEALAVAAEQCEVLDRCRVLDAHAREMHEAFLHAADRASKRDRSCVESSFEVLCRTVSDAIERVERRRA